MPENVGVREEDAFTHALLLSAAMTVPRFSGHRT